MSAKQRGFLSGVAIASVLAISLAVVVSLACGAGATSPTQRCANKIDCGDGTCCSLGHSCCGKYNGSQVCCDENYPHYCPSTNQCYKGWDQATAACGINNWVVCYKIQK